MLSVFMYKVRHHNIICSDRCDCKMFRFRDITDDEAFVDELRVTLRFFAAVLVRRTQKVTN